MKIRWKRINWGVLFALVLIAGLVIYLIVDNAKFKQSKSEIMETAERYLQEQPLAEKEGSGGSDALEELLNQYWAEIKPVSYTHLDVYKRQHQKQAVIAPVAASFTSTSATICCC